MRNGNGPSLSTLSTMCAGSLYTLAGQRLCQQLTCTSTATLA